ncbi:hypothetical protein CISG_03128 [Coccidioides immitis RMSCC 3703]|uniref:Uncharacterized protein n=2 Tax=Coccidioides immitis TaxID=5501 RepID=A0A0J8QN96_COCIT|nr:hypothetical protein CIRG_01210 [Coccidioides immitis RMSCC 2394]KMU72693.1 hypothetical protein CISG_03128 [Coccidioides immitis RMSCC 3703]
MCRVAAVVNVYISVTSTRRAADKHSSSPTPPVPLIPVHEDIWLDTKSDPASGRSATVNAGYSHFQPRGRFWTAARGEEQCRIEWAFSPRQWAFQHASWQQANNRRLRLLIVGVILNTSIAFWSPQLGRAESMTSRVPPNWKPPKNGDGTKWGLAPLTSRDN